MLFRILIGVGLAAAGYFVGREMGRREAGSSEIAELGERAGPAPPAAGDGPVEEAAEPKEPS